MKRHGRQITTDSAPQQNEASANGMRDYRNQQRLSFLTPNEWPSLFRVFYILWNNRFVFVAIALVTLIVAAMAFRSREKSYRSIAIISSAPNELTNPVKEVGGQEQGNVDHSSFFFNQMRTSLFNYEIIKQAAQDTGILGREMNRPKLREAFSSLFWRLAGGSISSDKDATERTLIDKIRFEKMSFEQLDRGSNQNQMAASGGLFRITATDENAETANKFLKRVIELHRDFLRKEEEDGNKKIAKFYDDQIQFFAGEAADSDSKIDFESNRMRLQTVNRLRSELDTKMQEEASIRSTTESKLSQLREELATAESKYSALHPEVVAARKALSESQKSLSSPVDRIRGEISSLKRKLDGEFGALIKSSESTVEGSGTAGEGHTQYFTKSQAERRSLSRVYERMQERYFQAMVQARLNAFVSSDKYKVIEDASLPIRPDSPKLIPWMMASLVVAFALALVGSLATELFRKQARDRWLISKRTRQVVWAEQRAGADFVLEANLMNPSQESKKQKRPLFSGLRAVTLRRSESTEVIDSLGALLTQLSAFQADDEGKDDSCFQCGIVPLAHQLPVQRSRLI